LDDPATDIVCVFRIQFAGTRRELARSVGRAHFSRGDVPVRNAVAGGEGASQQSRLRFLAGSIVFSLSLTSISCSVSPFGKSFHRPAQAFCDAATGTVSYVFVCCFLLWLRLR